MSQNDSDHQAQSASASAKVKMERVSLPEAESGALQVPKAKPQPKASEVAVAEALHGKAAKRSFSKAELQSQLSSQGITPPKNWTVAQLKSKLAELASDKKLTRGIDQDSKERGEKQKKEKTSDRAKAWPGTWLPVFSCHATGLPPSTIL